MSIPTRAALEPAIRRIGSDIFERAEDAAPGALSLEYWQQCAMEWLTADEDLKLRLFRFVEALPDLADHEAVANRLRSLLMRDAEHPPLPAILQLAVSYRRDDTLYATFVAALARWACGRMAHQFICGSTPHEAIASVFRLRREGMAFTLDVLGETVRDEQVAERGQRVYLELIEALSNDAPLWPPAPHLDESPWGRVPRVNISIKLSAIVTAFDSADTSATRRAVLDRLRPILRTARDRGAFINVDMEHYAVKNITLDIYKTVMMEPEFRDWPDCGIVIQAYLRDGRADMSGLIDWTRRRGTPITVRLVKGAYWDSETAHAEAVGITPPVFSRKHESDASFEDIASMMMAHADLVRPALASHNVRSIAAALALRQAAGLDPRAIEFQMLTGMGDPLKRALVGMGQRLRVYAPFGDMTTGMAYLIRRLLENTANESFLRQSFGAGVDRGELLRCPQTESGSPATAVQSTPLRIESAPAPERTAHLQPRGPHSELRIPHSAV